jgi:hypothetical protein
MSRFGGVLILLLFLGVPTLTVGTILYSMTTRDRRRYAILLIGMLVGMAVVGLSYPVVLTHTHSIAAAWPFYQPVVSQYLRAPSQEHWQALQPFFTAFMPQIVQLWLIALPLAPCVAVYLESTRLKALPELRADKQRQEQQRDGLQRREAARKVAQAPEQVKGKAVLGVPLSGELPDWRIKDWVTYPAELLNRHAVIIGGSGTGKTEFLLRLAYLAAKILKWRVFYIDAKGDYEVANRFMATMAHAGARGAAMFPDLAYRGWQGDATAILNRLMAIEDYSEPYYRAIAKTVLALACHAPGGPPRSSVDLLDRLNLATLIELYDGSDDRRADTLKTLTETDLAGVYKRYFGFFDAIGRKLDGSWSFETTDAGYVLLDGLALKEEARSLGRYLVEDFAHYVSKRKRADRRVLLIVDEFSAISRGGADAANLFERVRSYGAGVIVSGQSYEGLGADAARLIGAAWATIAFQCTDPEPIAARAGTTREVQTSLRTEYAALPGRNPLLSAKEHMTGTSTEHEAEVPRLHPNVIRNLGIGECCIITNGAYQAVRVARLPKLPDLGVVWGTTATTARIVPPDHAAPPRVVAQLLAVPALEDERDEAQATDLSTDSEIANAARPNEAAGDSAMPGDPHAPADDAASQAGAQLDTTTPGLASPRADVLDF